jgi:hypothetical protein
MELIGHNNNIPLPNEIINKIIQFLPIKEQQKSRIISKQFRDSLSSIQICKTEENVLTKKIEQILFDSLIILMPWIYEYLENEKTLLIQFVERDGDEIFSVGSDFSEKETILVNDISEIYGKATYDALHLDYRTTTIDGYYIRLILPSGENWMGDDEEIDLLQMLKTVSHVYQLKLENHDYDFICDDINHQTNVKMIAFINQEAEKIKMIIGSYLENKYLDSYDKKEWIKRLFNFYKF